MEIIELILDEEESAAGVFAISVVEHPAIESDFIALSEQQEVKFAEVNQEKKILMGAALIPNKMIYRRDGEREYNVYFSKETIEKTSQLFFKNGNQGESTLEHEMGIKGLTVVESWIVADEQKDKSRAYNMNVPVGTWMVSVKVDNDEIWDDYVKTGKVKGFSIEGYFADKTRLAKQKEEGLASQVKAIVKSDKRRKSGKRIVMESYSDYPDGVKNNAKRGIELNEKVNNKCATQVGKVRAQQLANGEPISVETIKRMYSYLSRAEEYYDEGDTKACGTISYLLWGGKAGRRWSESKLKELGLFEASSQTEDLIDMINRFAY